MLEVRFSAESESLLLAQLARTSDRRFWPVADIANVRFAAASSTIRGAAQSIRCKVRCRQIIPWAGDSVMVQPRRLGGSDLGAGDGIGCAQANILAPGRRDELNADRQ